MTRGPRPGAGRPCPAMIAAKAKAEAVRDDRGGAA